MKQFNKWNELKQKLDDQNTVPHFSEREIWWCSIGVNIGHEQDGKNTEFSRPVLVVKKFNKRLFLGVPLSTKIKNNKHYHVYQFHGQKRTALLSQIRLFDANRMIERMGRIGSKDFDEIKNKLQAYFK